MQRVLLIDRDDTRRRSRVMLLMEAGYEVEVRAEHVMAEDLGGEARFDLVILAMHHRLEDAAAYSERLRRANPGLPILLLIDYGVLVPQGTLSRTLESGDPFGLLRGIKEMLAASAHVRQLDVNG
jgi:DNA-binding NtrC family response regulator